MDKDHVIVALDFPYQHQGLTMAGILMPDCNFWKVGLQIFIDANMSFVRTLAQNDRVMLDLKFADTPDTVGEAIKMICKKKIRPHYLTVRGEPEVVTAAIKAKGGSEYPKIIHVPRLSSREDGSMDDYYLRQEIAALESVGCEGYVASGRFRIPVVRKSAPDKIIISPGIRLPNQDVNNHRHHCTPSEAFNLGSTFIVVGRPVIHAEDPKAALKLIHEDLKNVERPEEPE